jgi:hypothetical protein
MGTLGFEGLCGLGQNTHANSGLGQKTVGVSDLLLHGVSETGCMANVPAARGLINCLILFVFTWTQLIPHLYVTAHKLLSKRAFPVF